MPLLLTPRDTTTLTLLFDPESIALSTPQPRPPPPSTKPTKTSRPLQTFPPTTTFTTTTPSLPTLHTITQQIISPLLFSHSSAPSEEVLQTALAELTSLLSRNPGYAAAYLYRAQVLRLLGAGDEEVFGELGRAVDVVGVGERQGGDEEWDSEEHRRGVLSKAHLWRGFLLMAQAKRLRTTPSITSSIITQSSPYTQTWPQLRGKSEDEIEELANREFVRAGEYGCEVGRRMGVRTNVYRKICGRIVEEALRGEMVDGSGCW